MACAAQLLSLSSRIQTHARFFFVILSLSLVTRASTPDFQFLCASGLAIASVQCTDAAGQLLLWQWAAVASWCTCCGPSFCVAPCECAAVCIRCKSAKCSWRAADYRTCCGRYLGSCTTSCCYRCGRCAALFRSLCAANVAASSPFSLCGLKQRELFGAAIVLADLHDGWCRRSTATTYVWEFCSATGTICCREPCSTSTALVGGSWRRAAVAT